MCIIIMDFNWLRSLRSATALKTVANETTWGSEGRGNLKLFKNEMSVVWLLRKTLCHSKEMVIQPILTHASSSVML